MSNVIWKFKTANLTVLVTAETEYDPDVSFDETGETADKIASGEWEIFCAKATVLFQGNEIGTDYLGNCIYADIKEFRDHIGLVIKSRDDGRNYGSYFPDMVKTAISEARDYLRAFPKVRANA